jgi:hypothetical protein
MPLAPEPDDEIGEDQDGDRERPWLTAKVLGGSAGVSFAECFCGCGLEVRRRRRLWNEWGFGVAARLRRWDDLPVDRLFTERQFAHAAYEMREAFLDLGTVLFWWLQMAVHEGNTDGPFGRRQIRKWIKDSDRSLESVWERADRDPRF